MPKFMLILHDTLGTYPTSPEEIQRMLERYQTWMQGLSDKERIVSSEKLMEEGGKILTSDKGRLNVVDGPYSEAREVVGGYLTIRAANYEDAVAIASGCPHLSYGRIEIRETDPMGCGKD